MSCHEHHCRLYEAVVKKVAHGLLPKDAPGEDQQQRQLEARGRGEHVRVVSQHENHDVARGAAGVGLDVDFRVRELVAYDVDGVDAHDVVVAEDERGVVALQQSAAVLCGLQDEGEHLAQPAHGPVRRHVRRAGLF